MSTTDSPPAVSADTSLSRNVATEMAGTTLLMLAGPGALVLSNGSISEFGVAAVFGIAMAVSIGVIGAVANPMFTIALLIVREISMREAVGDWAGQLLGGVLGGALIYGINDLQRSPVGANGWDHSGFNGLGSVMAAELIFGAMVVAVLL